MPLAPPAIALPRWESRRWPKPVGFLFFVWALAAVSVISALTVTACFLILPFDRSGRWIWFITHLWARGNLLVAGVKVDARTEGRLPEGSCIFLVNHQSAIDIPALYPGLPRRFVFIAKQSVFRYPFIGWHMKAQGYISVDRSNRERSIKSMAAAVERIRGGLSVCAFPEGTRSKDGSILPFKKGPFMLALEAGVPVVPVAIEGALEVSPKRTWYVCPNTVRILLGPPIETAGIGEDGRDELMRRVRSEVIRLHRRIGGLGGDEKNAIAASGLEGIGRAAD